MAIVVQYFGIERSVCRVEVPQGEGMLVATNGCLTNGVAGVNRG